MTRAQLVALMAAILAAGRAQGGRFIDEEECVKDAIAIRDEADKQLTTPNPPLPAP